MSNQVSDENVGLLKQLVTTVQKKNDKEKVDNSIKMKPAKVIGVDEDTYKVFVYFIDDTEQNAYTFYNKLYFLKLSLILLYVLMLIIHPLNQKPILFIISLVRSYLRAIMSGYIIPLTRQKAGLGLGVGKQLLINQKISQCIYPQRSLILLRLLMIK